MDFGNANYPKTWLTFSYSHCRCVNLNAVIYYQLFIVDACSQSGDKPLGLMAHLNCMSLGIWGHLKTTLIQKNVLRDRNTTAYQVSWSSDEY